MGVSLYPYREETFVLVKKWNSSEKGVYLVHEYENIKCQNVLTCPSASAAAVEGDDGTGKG